jgi:hypothetical protein
MNEAITLDQPRPIIHTIHAPSAVKEVLTELELGNHCGKICIFLDSS